MAPAQEPHEGSVVQSIDSDRSYKIIAKAGKGSYGSVFIANIVGDETHRKYALKTVNIFGSREGFPMDAIREIKALQRLDHKNIVKIHDIVITDGENGQEWFRTNSGAQMFLVMDYCEHDMAGLIYDKEKVVFHEAQIKSYIHQLLSAVAYMHDKNFLHRDIKTANILVLKEGVIKLADFGLSKYENPQIKGRKSHNVQTLWYRAPELLLGDQRYSSAIDMWSVGCVLAEFMGRRPLFFGRDEKHQLEQIFYLRGTPHEEKFPQACQLPKWKDFAPKEYQDDKLRSARWFKHMSGNCVVDLLGSLLQLDPAKRITAREALNHPWFKAHPLANHEPSSVSGTYTFQLPSEPRNIMYIKKKETERKNSILLNKSLRKRKRDTTRTAEEPPLKVAKMAKQPSPSESVSIQS